MVSTSKLDAGTGGSVDAVVGGVDVVVGSVGSSSGVGADVVAPEVLLDSRPLKTVGASPDSDAESPQAVAARAKAAPTARYRARFIPTFCLNSPTRWRTIRTAILQPQGHPSL
ncbi:MAG: hypothetical protein HKN03_15880 [Acidimicrobiales bacterium]|nr:hypothetical protein [Acidimicrobiales bacterium]